MKFNLTKKQIIWALLYSLLVPIFSYIDMQLTINHYSNNLFSEFVRIFMIISTIISFPFLILGFLGATLLSSIFGIGFMPIGLFIIIFIQVVLLLHILNKRKVAQNDYFKNKTI